MTTETNAAQTELLALLHKANYEMLLYVDEICRENDINFYLWGGSLLGAVRHKGFIPWDDDADIVMFRKDFDRFVAAVRRRPDDRFTLYLPEEQASFVTFIPMLFYKNSRLRRDPEMCWNCNQLHLDIFLLDNTAAQRQRRTLHGLELTAIYGMAMGHRAHSGFSERFSYSLIQRAGAATLATIGRLFSLQTILKWHKQVSAKYDKQNTGYVFCTNNAPTCLGEKHSHPASVYEQTLRQPFEGTTMPIPSGYDVIMRSGYGDYMQPPPPEKQCVDHAVLEELEVDGISLAALKNNENG